MSTLQRHPRLASFVQPLLAMAAAVLLFAEPAHAQWRVGGFVGGEHESSWDEFLLVGADARGVVGSRGLEFNPRLTYFLRSKTTRFQVDLNIIKPLLLATPGRVEPFVGVGAALERVSYSSGANTSETNVGFNYIVGGTMKSNGQITPFGQFQYTVLHDAPNNAVVSVGLHYSLAPKSMPPAKPVPATRRR